MTHRYRVYGLILQSDLPCPELLAATPERPADIDVRLADLDDALDQGRSEANGSDVRARMTPGLFAFSIKDVARYQVEAGQRILVDPAPGAAPGDVRLWLLGTALGALLHQRGLLPLHVSAVALEGTAYAFCGDSGAGKSTLAAALHRQGLPLLTDDVGLAVPDGKQVTFHPGFPRIKLWRDALEHFDIDHRPLTRDLTRSDKFHLTLDTDSGFQVEPLPLGRLYLLERGEGEDVRIERVKGHATISLIQANTYRPGLIHRFGQAAAHLRQCAIVAQRVQVYRFRRPFRLDRLQPSLQLLRKHLQTDPERD